MLLALGADAEFVGRDCWCMVGSLSSLSPDAESWECPVFVTRVSMCPLVLDWELQCCML